MPIASTRLGAAAAQDPWPWAQPGDGNEKEETKQLHHPLLQVKIKRTCARTEWGQVSPSHRGAEHLVSEEAVPVSFSAEKS